MDKTYNFGFFFVNVRILFPLYLRCGLFPMRTVKKAGKSSWQLGEGAKQHPSMNEAFAITNGGIKEVG